MGLSGQAARKWLKNTGQVRLRCAGLDYSGWIYVNGHEVERVPWLVRPPHLRSDAASARTQQPPPDHLRRAAALAGAIRHTSRITEWKPRFNYTWDWTSRLVQIGIWDAITLEAIDGAEIESLRCVTEVDRRPARLGASDAAVSDAQGAAWRCRSKMTVDGDRLGVIPKLDKPDSIDPIRLSSN